MSVSKFFKQASVQDSFEKNGYVVLNIVDENEIVALKKVFDKYFDKQLFERFTYSNSANNKQKNFELQQEIKFILKPKIDLLIQDYRIVLGLFYIKPSGKKSDFYLHRDWSIVDEDKYSSLNIWLPLTEINKTNGNLVVIPQSHKEKSWRGSPFLNYPKMSLIDKINSLLKSKNIYTKKGEAVFFDHRLLHSSNKNLSGQTRIVVGMSIVPQNAQLIHYRQLDNDKVEMLKVQDDFYLSLDFDTINHIEQGGVIDLLGK